jgi:hypothetical protein
MNVFAFTTMAVFAAGSSVQSIDGVWRSQGWRFGTGTKNFSDFPDQFSALISSFSGSGVQPSSVPVGGQSGNF